VTNYTFFCGVKNSKHILNFDFTGTLKREGYIKNAFYHETFNFYIKFTIVFMLLVQAQIYFPVGSLQCQ